MSLEWFSQVRILEWRTKEEPLCPFYSFLVDCRVSEIPCRFFDFTLRLRTRDDLQGRSPTPSSSRTYAFLRMRHSGFIESSCDHASQSNQLYYSKE